jgi:hypothetical protein
MDGCCFLLLLLIFSDTPRRSKDSLDFMSHMKKWPQTVMNFHFSMWEKVLPSQYTFDVLYRLEEEGHFVGIAK